MELSPEERARVDSLIEELLASTWTAMKSGETAGMSPLHLNRLNLDYALLVRTQQILGQDRARCGGSGERESPAK